MIDLTMNEKVLENAVARAKERNIIIPTFEEQRNPKKLVPQRIQQELSELLKKADQLNREELLEALQRLAGIDSTSGV